MQLLVNIDVPNLQPAVAFYCEALGLRVGRRFGDDAAELLGGTSPIYLLVKDACTQASSHSPDQRHYERHWTPVHLDFVVDDIDAAVARAQAAGATLEQPARSAKWGKLALMADPFGNGFCLVQFLNRGYDEIATA